MSSLTDADKRYLGNILEMGDGFVLDYTDATFGEFFTSHKIDIHSPRYRKYGPSKAKKMRAFWELEPNEIVAPILAEMLAVYEANCELNGKEIEKMLSISRKLQLFESVGKFSTIIKLITKMAF